MDTNFSIQAAGKKILQSGMVHSFDESGVTFHFNDLVLALRFQNDELDKSQRIVRKLDGDKSLIMTFFNFNNALGTGTTSPIKLGSILDKALLAHFTVYSINKQSPKLIHFTFFVEQ
jgi:hypothetical protein